MAGGVTSCANGNRVEVEFDAFDASADTVVADYAALVEGAALDQDMAADAGCMARPADTRLRTPVRQPRACPSARPPPAHSNFSQSSKLSARHRDTSPSHLHMKHLSHTLILLPLLLGVGCGDSDTASASGAWVWNLPDTVPEPRVPEDNPMSEEKVELGRFLVLRHEALGQPDPELRNLSSSRARVHRWAGPSGRLDGRDPSAQLDEHRQLRLRGIAHLGEPGRGAPRRASPGADVR